ncbi:hypothetical protein ABC347_01710 [Sphingomonas sp. 1P06PA]|uniref:hypothetical protein n=1 Tax=Sphingomonas sp. 1P06PA TaxID=554121 RepID=UPI0039A54937
MPLYRVAIATMLCLGGVGCGHRDTEQEAIIAAALASDQVYREISGKRPCIQADVRSSSSGSNSGVVYPLPSRLLPKSLNLCGNQIDEYFQIYDPEIVGNRATLDLDFHCGGLCGAGSTLALERSNAR